MNKHTPLIIGISLPIIFILVISIVIFGPAFFVKPQYDFIYTTESDRYSYNQQEYKNTYDIKDGHIVLEPVEYQKIKENDTYYDQIKQKHAPVLYVYNMKTNSSHEISFADAQKLSLDPGPSSPDGYTVSYQYNHDGIFELFGSSGQSNGYFISKDNGKKKLNALVADEYWGQGSFKLIGWINN